MSYKMKKYDLVVIGSGPGGYVAALEAARLGLKTVIVEKTFLGGTCLNRGCIPTKAMVVSAKVYRYIKQADSFGIKVGSAKVDFSSVVKRKNAVVSKLGKGIEFLLKNRGVDIVYGEAGFLSRNRVSVKGEGELEADNIIIAAGSEPLIPDNIMNDGEFVFNSNQILSLDRVPDSMVVIGGGYIGCEFASIFASFGTRVYLVEMLPEILPGFDRETVKLLISGFKKNGVEVITGTKVKTVKGSKNGGFVNLENSKKIAADAVLLAVGRRLNTSIEGIEVLNLDIERGRIATNGSMRTNVKNIFAVGDVTGKSLLASVAYCQGLVAARSCAGEEQEMNYDVIPSCIFTFPEIAAVGITEQQAKERGLKVRVGKFPFSAVGRSLADGSGEGFVKIVSGYDDGRIYGCHIAGGNAGEILSEVTLAMSRGLKVKDIAEAVHIHPTLSEGVMESALAVYGLSPHIPLKK